MCNMYIFLYLYTVYTLGFREPGQKITTMEIPSLLEKKNIKIKIDGFYQPAMLALTGVVKQHPTLGMTTKIITFLIGNPYKPSFTTVTVRGPHPNPTKKSGNFFGQKNGAHEKVEFQILLAPRRPLAAKKRKPSPWVTPSRRCREGRSWYRNRWQPGKMGEIFRIKPYKFMGIWRDFPYSNVLLIYIDPCFLRDDCYYFWFES